MKSLNIAMLVYGYPPWDVYGVPRHVERLSEYLSGIGHNVWIITRKKLKLKKIEHINKNFLIYRTYHLNLPALNKNIFNIITIFLEIWDKFLYTLMAIIEGSRLVNKNKIQILHGHHLEYGGFQAFLLGKLLKKPIIITIHGSGLDYYSKYEKIPFKLRFLKSPNLKIICQKKSALKILQKWNIPPQKIEYITEQFVNTDKFNPKNKVRHIKYKNIIFVGRLIKFKGPNLLIEAIPAIIKKFQNLRFLFAGEGPILKDLQQRVTELGIQNHVKFLNLVKNIEKIYSIADISVSLSYHENFTDMALLEAMSFGIPIVATDVGETSQIIKNEITGLLAKCDSQDIAEKICFLLENTEFSIKLGANARNLIIDYYSMAGKMHENLYYAILNHRTLNEKRYKT